MHKFSTTMQRDSIDFEKTDIAPLFFKLFVPTLLGLLFGAALNIADGIFVGKGVGSDALAAVNIAAPIFLIGTGLALLTGTGASVVAAIHLAKNNVKAANINVTQAVTVSTALMAVVCTFVYIFPELTAKMFGGSDKLMPLVKTYFYYGLPCVFVFSFTMAGMFIIRLDGSPKYAMLTNVVPSVLNIILDYIFVFPLQMGLKGAALATSIAQVTGSIMVAVYFWKFSKTIKFYRPKFTNTSIHLTMRNVGYMAKVGMSGLIGELAIMLMIMAGNFQFMKLLHEDGVAAYSVACYLFPLVFMFGNAISQSALPIISFNHGKGIAARVSKTLKLSVVFGLACGVVITALTIVCCRPILQLFLTQGSNAFEIAANGLPYFAVSFLFFTLNLVLIGYYQSIEKIKKAIIYMTLRGLLFMIPCFIIMPQIMGEQGLWLAVPMSEFLTFLTIAVASQSRYKKKKS